jgi:hypothetical protein
MALREIKLNDLPGTNFTIQSKGMFSWRITVDPATGARILYTDLPLPDAQCKKLVGE